MANAEILYCYRDQIFDNILTNNACVIRRGISRIARPEEGLF